MRLKTKCECSERKKKKHLCSPVQTVLTLGGKIWSTRKQHQPGKCIPRVMHDATKVIHLSQWVNFAWFHLQEVILLPFRCTDNQCNKCKEKHLQHQQKHSHSFTSTSNHAAVPCWMLSLMMLTCSSRSGRVCSCQKPITWPSSCTTMPNLSQFFPIEIAWGPPPLLPT